MIKAKDEIKLFSQQDAINKKTQSQFTLKLEPIGRDSAAYIWAL